MKERHWNSLVTGVRHGQCILVLGPEIPAGTVGAPVGAAASSFAEELTGALATELEEDDNHVTGTTLAAVAQQYEDAKASAPLRCGRLRRSRTNRRNSCPRMSMPPSRSCLSA